jgi:hypothetical protein
MNHIEHGDVAARARALAKQVLAFGSLAKQLVAFAEDCEQGFAPKPPTAMRVDYDPHDQDLPVVAAERPQEVDGGADGGHTIRFGNNRGQLLHEADDETIVWYLHSLERGAVDRSRPQHQRDRDEAARLIVAREARARGL